MAVHTKLLFYELIAMPDIFILIHAHRQMIALMRNLDLEWGIQVASRVRFQMLSFENSCNNY